MDYLVIIQKEIPKQGGPINTLVNLIGNENVLRFSSFAEAQRIAARLIGLNFIDNHMDLYVAVVTFYNCNCIRTIVDILFMKKIIVEDIDCNALNTPIDANPLTYSILGNETLSITIDSDVPNNDWFVLIRTKEPYYGTLTQIGYNFIYKAIDTLVPFIDTIEYSIVSVITGCLKKGIITININ